MKVYPGRPRAGAGQIMPLPVPGHWDITSILTKTSFLLLALNCRLEAVNPLKDPRCERSKKLASLSIRAAPHRQAEQPFSHQILHWRMAISGGSLI